MINFEQHLKRKGLSENTIRAYVYRFFPEKILSINRESIRI